MAGPGTVVLVHGGFVDGSGWQGVYNLLRKDGYSVAIVQNPTLSLEDDAAVTRRVVDAQEEPVVLVGHSYGGAVITEAGNDPNVAALVYIAAFAPDKGESVNMLIAGFPPGRTCAADLAAAGWIPVLDREKFHDSFAADVDAELAAFMADSQVPWGVGALGRHDHRGRVAEQAKLVSDRDRRSDDPGPAQREMSGRAGATVEETAASHSLYVSQPEAVAAIIKKAASEVGSASA